MGYLIKKGIDLDFSGEEKVLYLGAATGTTASHLSDILPNGDVFCVEYSEKSLNEFINRCQDRGNLYPILGDARKPRKYSKFLGLVDFLYQDITQRNQVEVFEKNAKHFLKNGSMAILILKAKSIDVSKTPQEIFREKKEKLGSFEILEEYDLDPYYSDHLALVTKFNK